MKKYSLEGMLHVIEDQNGNLTELERTKMQKNILESQNRISQW